MTLVRVCLLLACLEFGAFAPASAWADKLDEIPVKKFRLSTHRISVSPISDVKPRAIVVNSGTALVNDGRNLWLLDTVRLWMQEKKISSLSSGSTWYGPACKLGNGFVIAVQDYPVEQQNKEEATPRGGFRAGPTSSGFVIVDAFAPDRHIEKLTVSGRPPPGPVNIPEDNRRKEFSDDVQSCAWDGKRMVFGAYGSIGMADFDSATIELIEEDEELEFSRFPLLVESHRMWFGVDEGGLGGASLRMRTAAGRVKDFGISASQEYDVVSFTALVRHQGQLIVGSTHGLFSLDEPSGRFQRFDFGLELSSKPVTWLVSRGGFLWVFIGGEWLRVSVREEKAVRYVSSTSQQFLRGNPFGNGWLLSGEAGIWVFPARDTSCEMPNPSLHRTCAKSRAGR